MLFYICLALFLVPFYFIELGSLSRAKSYGLSVFLSVVYFIILAGLRDDTGYDWYVYKSIYAGIADSDTLSSAIEYGKLKGSEVGFSTVLYFISRVGFNFWVVQLLISTFNCYAFIRMNNVLGRGSIAGLLIYFCWLFLVLQMGVMRMSVALAFLSLALISRKEDKNYKFWCLVIAASFFHLFSMVIGLIIWLASKELPKKMMISMIVVLSVAYFVLAVDLAGGVIRSVSAFTPEFISSKLDMYLTLGESYQRGMGETLYKLVMLCLVAFVSLRADNSGLQRFLLNLSMLYILVLLFFWKFPIFHDRIKYFVFMPIFYLFWMVLDKSRYGNRLVYGGVFAIISLSVLCYEVTGSMFYPYEPYYNIYEKWLGGGTNDGEDRTLRYYNHFDSQWQGGNK